MTETEIKQAIIDGSYENSILKFLLKDRLQYIDWLEGENVGLNATVAAIRKINRDKNEAIAALCEPEEPHKFIRIGVF